MSGKCYSRVNTGYLWAHNKTMLCGLGYSGQDSQEEGNFFSKTCVCECVCVCACACTHAYMLMHFKGIPSRENNMWVGSEIEAKSERNSVWLKHRCQELDRVIV